MVSIPNFHNIEAKQTDIAKILQDRSERNQRENRKRKKRGGER